MLVLVGSLLLSTRWRVKALAALLIPGLLALIPRPGLPPGIAVVAQSQSLYGLVEVIEDTNRGVRFLRADHSIIGAQGIIDRAPSFAFIYLLETVRFLRPGAKSLLEVGLGIGSLPMGLARYGIEADVVEIDPAVVRLAQSHFGFSTRGTIFVEDARTFLGRTNRRYDLIVHDTFTGGTTPEHLLSLEVVRRTHELLRSNGVLVLNFAGYSAGAQAEASWAVARTLGAVFANVRIFRDDAPVNPSVDPANLVYFASDGPLRFEIPADDAAFEDPWRREDPPVVQRVGGDQSRAPRGPGHRRAQSTCPPPASHRGGSLRGYEPTASSRSLDPLTTSGRRWWVRHRQMHGGDRIATTRRSLEDDLARLRDQHLAVGVARTMPGRSARFW